MKFRYTFTKQDKTITVNMFLNTMDIYDRYIKMNYLVKKREVLIDNEWIDIDELLTKII